LDRPAVLLAFPLRLVHGMVATAARADHIRQMIEQVLFTMPGERVMYPDFGAGLERLLFETTATEITTATQSLVSVALQRWLGDVISVRDVRIAVVESTLSVTVTYEVLETRDLRQERFER